MALSISGNLIVDEESRNPSTGAPENEVATLSADQALIDYLNGLNQIRTSASRNMPSAMT
jgi:hypothetical protein